MPTYKDITYHIVFGTKNRIPALDKPRRENSSGSSGVSPMSAIAMFIASAVSRIIFTF